jgi:hypothetical protein
MGKQMNASNHYAFTYFVHWTKDYIEYQFFYSKYTFGSNILMFVEHLHDRDYFFFQNSTVEHNVQRVPKLLMAFY